MFEIILESSKRLIDALPEGMHRFLFDAFSIEEVNQVAGGKWGRL